MRLRIHFAKTAPMRYTGHLDLHRTWERTFRRARLPLAYTQGFNPHPRLTLAAALPLGFTSESELLDVWLEQDLPTGQVQEALEPALPPGLQVIQIEVIDSQAPTLQAQVRSSDYVVTLVEACPDLADRINQLLETSSLLRTRRGKPYDLRPLIEALAILPDDPQAQPRFQARLAARESATGRPEEVLDALGIEPSKARVHRTSLIFE
jgi:radical SAM-linked protein